MSSLIIVLKKEIKEMFRDKKSLAMMLVVPIMIPVIIIGISALFDSTANKPVTDYNKIGFSYELSSVEESIASSLNIEFIIKDELELKKDCDNGNIDMYVIKDGDNYTIKGYDSEMVSYTSGLLNSYFASYKDYLQKEYLADKNIDPAAVIDIINVETKLEVTESFFASYITNYGFLFIIMAITVSATYPSTDATAGEKERGTLETLLTFPMRSKDIILGKFLGVALSSVITGLISLILMIVSLLAVNNMFTMYAEENLMLSPVSILYALIVIIAYSLLISGLCIAIASKSKSFKEAQSALTPLTFISMFPGMIAFMIDIQSSTLLSVVPFINFTLLFGDIIAGNVNILNIVLMLLSTVVIISVMLVIIIRQYKSEKVLFNN